MARVPIYELMLDGESPHLRRSGRQSRQDCTSNLFKPFRPNCFIKGYRNGCHEDQERVGNGGNGQPTTQTQTPADVRGVSQYNVETSASRHTRNMDGGRSTNTRMASKEYKFGPLVAAGIMQPGPGVLSCSVSGEDHYAGMPRSGATVCQTCR